MTGAEQAALDMEKVGAFGERLAGFLNGGSAALMISIGHRVGLFDAMAGLPASTSTEIADAAGLDERYVREWLGAMVTAGVVEYESSRAVYVLPPEHAALTIRAAGPNNFANVMQFIPLVAAVEEEVIDKFRHGGGVPYSSYGRFHEAMAELSGASFDANLVDVVLPLVPGIVERLDTGIDVADIGTGSGHAVNVMARAFPNSRFVGYDFSEAALSRGRAEAEAWGLSNATFEARDVATLDGSRTFGFVTTFDAVHDQADPRAVVRGIHASLEPGAYWLCVDVRASSHVGENVDHPLGTFGYTVSCMHCMTVSLAYGGEGLGAMWGVHQAREIFAEAGFGAIEVHSIEGDPMNNYYVCRRN
ncbi:MAG TPA: methyltransferase domain-containing protein [Acidimicrobiia bacterium]|nr:methyltransferase domain-containing protein [Acidimicrobiia bacterium]